MGFEWDLEGGDIFMRRATYGFDWDFDGGHFMRFGFEWDLEEGIYQVLYDLGGILFTYQRLTMLQPFYIPELTHRASRALSS